MSERRALVAPAMQRLIMSTDDIPEAERFAYWREAVSDGLIGVSGERDKDKETPFNGKVEGWIGESFTRFRYRADRFHVLRQQRDIARRSWEDCYLLYRELSAAPGSTTTGASLSPGPTIW